MSQRFFILVFLTAAGLLYAATTRGAPVAAQDDLAAFKTNSCVKCHATEMPTSNLSNKYLEWYLSTHKLSNVGCEKCHGGNPTSNSAGKAHEGMLPPSDSKSMTNPVNLPATCNSCHEGISTAFTGSKHFASMMSNGGGPSCSACHQHMASNVIVTPADGAALCSTCHVAGGKTAASKHLEVPAKAQEVMASLERADGIVVWAQGLLDAAKERKLDVAAEEKDMAAVKALVADAKSAWHTFTLVGVTDKADKAFQQGTKVKDALRKKLGYS